MLRKLETDPQKVCAVLRITTDYKRLAFQKSGWRKHFSAGIHTESVSSALGPVILFLCEILIPLQRLWANLWDKGKPIMVWFRSGTVVFVTMAWITWRLFRFSFHFVRDIRWRTGRWGSFVALRCQKCNKTLCFTSSKKLPAQSPLSVVILVDRPRYQLWILSQRESDTRLSRCLGERDLTTAARWFVSCMVGQTLASSV